MNAEEALRSITAILADWFEDTCECATLAARISDVIDDYFAEPADMGWFQFEHPSVSDSIRVRVYKPKGYGEGYASELAIQVLTIKCRRMYGDQWKPPI